MGGEAFLFLIPISLFLAVAAVLIAIVVQGGRNRRDLQETVRKSIDAGAPMSPEAIRALGFKPRDDLRTGLILVAVWAAFAILGLMIGLEDVGRRGFEWDEFGPMIGVGAFPGLIGAALISLHLVRKGDR